MSIAVVTVVLAGLGCVLMLPPALYSTLQLGDPAARGSLARAASARVVASVAVR